MKYEKTVNGILFSADKQLLRLEVIHTYLSEESYWAQNIPLSIVEAAIKGSLCFAAYDKNKQIAFARVITDVTSFAYLADVFVLKEFRGNGVGKELMRFVFDYPGFASLRRFMLATNDAHTLYEKFGFSKLVEPDKFMERKYFEKYNKF